MHGPDSASGGIVLPPNTFPVHEDTQFLQLMSDSIEYFSIGKPHPSYNHLFSFVEDSMDEGYEYVLADTKTGEWVGDIACARPS